MEIINKYKFLFYSIDFNIYIIYFYIIYFYILFNFIYYLFLY